MEIELSDAIRNSVLLEIETCGTDGLRFRSQLRRAKSDGWLAVSAFSIPRLKDAAGAGDWCTAGILDVLTRNGFIGLKQASAARVRDAMEYGQALAAWNCGFEGARGGMYQQDRSQFATAVDRILKGKDRPVELNQKRLSQQYLPQLCRACNEPGGTGQVVNNKRQRRHAIG